MGEGGGRDWGGGGREGGDWVERGVTEEVREAFPKSYIFTRRCMIKLV